MRRDNRGTRPESRVAPIHVLLGAALLGLLVMPLALAGAKPTEATSSSSAKKQIRSLTRRIAALEQRQSATSLPPQGPAGGDLMGNYPNPQIGPNTVRASDLGSAISVQTQAPVAPGTTEGLSVTCPDGTRLLSGGFKWGDRDANGASVMSSGPPVGAGAGDPNTVWSVEARVDTGGQANTIFARALCLSA